MIADKDTNTVYFSELIKTDSRFLETSNQIISTLENFGAKFKFLPDTKDIWARDYMPIQINDNKYIEYRFDPDYLQGSTKGYRDLKTYPDIVCDTIKLQTKKSDLILDGGNFVKSNDCIILADKIVKENRILYTKTKLIKKLQETFEVDKIVLIPWDKSEEYGHSDGMVRFIDNETVLTQYYFKDYSAMLKPLKQAGFKIEYIDYTVKKNDKRNWAYLNFLQTKDFILLPKFGIDEDGQAFEQIENFYSDYKGNIVQIDMNETLKFGGTLNCISWTTKE
ncbi:agmatine deiminase family protein [Reichenbachiella sp. MALMAid0571]|uniref:agmatine deiminase family protein n=1 Tax=Reichenbachiella sp. MALMAid0571 TaxID=3143939 RepID=UPI0032DE71AE